MSQLDETARKPRESIIIQEYDGVYPPFEAFYIQSIIYAAGQSEAAFERFETAASESGSAALVVATVQEALTHAAALSRFFWPARSYGLALARGTRLRDAFDLEDSSPLKCRRLRNMFEHFDEALDVFLLRDPVGYMLPSPIVSQHGFADEPIANIFKLVDPEDGVCVLLGQKFDFQPIRLEVQRIHARALEKSRQGCRL